MFTQRIKSSKSLTERWQAHCENGPRTTGTPLFLSPASLLLPGMQFLHPSSVRVQTGAPGWALGGASGREGFDIRLSHREPREPVHKSESSTQSCLLILWMKIHGTYLEFFSLPCISSRTVTWTQPSRWAMIHPGYGSYWLILSKDGSEARRGQTLIQRLMTLIWERRLNTVPWEAAGRWLKVEDGPLPHGYCAGQEAHDANGYYFRCVVNDPWLYPLPFIQSNV